MSMHALTGEIPHFTIAERIVLARTVAGLEQQEVADRVGMSRTTLSGYESRAWPRKRKDPYLRAIARVCRVDELWLMTGIESTPGPADAATPDKSEEQITGSSSLAPVINFTKPVKESPASQPFRKTEAA
jgi:transcriptional regulator with XRE-family HTH domain